MSEKEVEDALYMLLNCSLKDTKYTTQKEQFEVIKKYIVILEQENQPLKKQLKKRDEVINELEKWLNHEWKQPLAKIYVGDVIKELNKLKGDNNE